MSFRNGGAESVVHLRVEASLTDVDGLRTYAGRPVCVRLSDGREFVGRLRTELLTDLSISVFLAYEKGGGATIYIEDIATLSPP